LLNQFTEIPTSVSPGARQDVSATLHQVDLFVRFNYASGLFSQFDALWSQQSNRRYSPGIPAMTSGSSTLTSATGFCSAALNSSSAC